MTTADLSALRIHRDEEGPGRPRRGRRILWAGATVALIAVGILAWRGGWLNTSAPLVGTARPIVLQAGDAEEILTATGYIVPQLESEISARVSGRLAWLGVDEGSRVKKGAVIARLDNDDLAAQVAEAQAEIARSKAGLEQARASLWEAGREQDRQRNLLAQGITTQADFDSAQRAHDVAAAGLTAGEAAVRAAEARLTLTQANYDKTIIRAPFDGVVTKKSAEVGEMVAAGAFTGQPTGGAIVTLADFATLEMEADINESNLSKVSIGQAALVSVDAVPDRRYRGTLHRFVPAADRQKGIVQAKVRLLDPDDRLVPDMSARVVFLSREVDSAEVAAPPQLFVPSSAVGLEGSAPYVLVVRDDRAARVPVTLGESRGDLRRVVSGLRGDETVIVEGVGALTDGARVRISP